MIILWVHIYGRRLIILLHHFHGFMSLQRVMKIRDRQQRVLLSSKNCLSEQGKYEKKKKKRRWSIVVVLYTIRCTTYVLYTIPTLNSFIVYCCESYLDRWISLEQINVVIRNVTGCIEIWRFKWVISAFKKV